MRMNLGILGFPLFKHTHLPLFFCNGNTSVVGTSLLGLGTSATYPQETQEIAGVSPLRGRTGCLLQGLHQGVDQAAGERCAGAQGCPVSRPFRETVHWAARLGFGKENFLGIWREAGFGQIGVSVSRKTFQRCLNGLLYIIWYVYTYISTYYTLSCNHYRYKCWYPKIGYGSKCDSN